MIALIDSIFAPFLNWLARIHGYIDQMSVPLSRPLNISDYLGPFVLLGPQWIFFISSAFALAFLYIIIFVVMSLNGLTIKFKDVVKWW